ncbi:GntR family transcriptional regulator [Radiobacillus kanasensis]|uniref:GntR family transcriptional regulator n=1 Tax=Radiobacillus kanasensis TaxID=2844358 RepID=UPI001E42A1D6|nr:GntR family transcriptional regulator [Radiobacillus kanasensis]UFT98684.1 GntR family transcriptional regulator [Radiobacillus kanasensis]
MAITRKKGPLYTQIKNILKDRILHGVYPIHSNIPSEPQLEEEFGVSKITVRKAVEELVQEGLLEKKSGKGTKVIQNTSASRISRGKFFTEFLVEKGHQINKKLLEIKQVQTKEDPHLQPLFDESCLCIRRVYNLDGTPYIHFTHYLSNQLGTIDSHDIQEQSLYGLIEKRDIFLEKFEDYFNIATATPVIAKELQVDTGTPLLKRMRYSYDEMNNLIEYSEGYYNTELHDYVKTEVQK